MNTPTLRIAKLSDIQPDAKNANRHTARGAGVVERSLRERGFVRPMAAAGKGVAQPVILAGNLTQETAVGIGMDEAIIIETDGTRPIVHVRTDLEPGTPQAVMAALEDNRSAELSLDFDVPQIEQLRTELDLDLGPLWNEDEWQAKLAEIPSFTNGEGSAVEESEPDVDRGEELRKKYGVQLGQIWALGEHRIGCIDCKNTEAVEKLLAGATPSFVWADPPYGISIVAANVPVGGGEAYDIPFGGVKNKGNVGGGEAIKASPGLYPIQMRAKGLGSIGGAKPFGQGNGDKGGIGAANPPGSKNNLRIAPNIQVGKYSPVIGDDTTATAETTSELYLSLFPHALHVWWGANYYAHVLPPSSCWIVWDKQNTGNFADAELAWCSDDSAVRIFQHMWNGLMKASEKGVRRVHPTQKPIALAKWAFEKYGSVNDVILDPFMGSGMSLMAAEQLGNRRVMGCELSPEYIAIVIDRWAAATGKQPKQIEGF